MQRRIEISSENWKKYCYAVGDYNPIHWNTKMAQSFGLEGKIAPGMFIASHIQGGRNITGARIKFSGSVYDGDSLVVDEVGDGGYIFKRGDDVVCEVKGVKEDDFDLMAPKLFSDNEVLHRYFSSVCESNVGVFLGSLGIEGGDNLYGMYLASLSGPALLDFGKKNGFVGIHASQTFTAYRDVEPGFVDVLIGGLRERGPLQSYELQWINRRVRGDSGVIASGRAFVLPLKKGE